MPQLNIEDWNTPDKKKPVPIIIDGDALDITPSGGDEEDDTEVKEPPFIQDPSRDREPLQSENPFALIPYGPVRTLKVEELHTKWHLIRQLMKVVPLNEYGLPELVYRADMLDHEWVQQTLLKVRGMEPSTIPDTQDPATTSILPPANGAATNAGDIQAHLDAAVVKLEYFEGFPVTPDGEPFWSKLDWESQADYEMFVAYLESGADRAMHKLIAWPTEEVRSAFHVYCWDIRVRAFELFRVANAAKVRLKRMLDVDDSQYTRANKFLDRVEKVLDAFTADEIKETGFDKLVKTFTELMKVQRVAAGLPAAGPPLAEDMVRAPTTNIIMQQIAAQTPEKVEESDENLDILQDSPEILELAQDFIIRSQKAKPIND